MGPVESDENAVYLRPETAQGIFINFENVRRTARMKLPFGIAQIGKSFRNEITPGQFVFRTREFEQMEMEYFVRPEDAAGAFADFLSGLGCQRLHVLASGLERRAATLDLLGNAALTHEALGHAALLRAEHQGLANDHARGYRDSLEYLQPLPLPLCGGRHTAAN